MDLSLKSNTNQLGLQQQYTNSNNVPFVSPRNSLRSPDPSLLPVAGKLRKSHEYDMISNGGKPNGVGIARTLHSTDDPVLVGVDKSSPYYKQQRSAVSQRLPPPDILNPRKSLRELNLEKQRQRLIDE